MIQEWNLTTGKIERIKTLAKSSYKIGKALSATPALSNDRKILAIGFQDGEYRLLDVSTPEKAAVDPNYKKEIEEIYSGRLPDLRTRFKIGEESSFLQNSSTENSSVHNLAWSEDDNMLAVTSTAGVSSILLVQREGGFSFSNLTSFVAGVSPSHQSSTNQLGCQLFFTRNKQLVGITTDGALRLWDFTPNDDFDANLTRNQGADVARTSKDGRTLLVLRYDGDKAGLRAYIDKEEEEKWFIPGIKDFQPWRDANHEKELCLALDENGEYDFEVPEAIDIEQFNQDMLDLLDGKTVSMPTFNFRTGKREYNGKTLRMGEEDILVIEGIHCLNDSMSYRLPADCRYRIYISALTQLNIDEHNRIPSRDGRLIRRIVRDARTRGTKAEKTIAMWPSVRRGEERHIFPNQEKADVMFNSALIYELAVLKSYAQPLLFEIGADSPCYSEARRLLKFLEYFVPITPESIPGNSILREFIGGGCFDL